MNILIVGGGYAGVTCALRLARRLRCNRSRVRIRLVSPQPVLTERIRLHRAAAGQPLPERRIDTLLARAGVEWIDGWVDAIDPQARTMHIGKRTLAWDRLVLALGSQVGVRDVPGGEQHALDLEPASVPLIQAALTRLPAGARVAVVGGGLTGIETATEIAESYPRLQVHLVCRGAVAADFSAAAQTYFAATFARLRIETHAHVAVRAVAAQALMTEAGRLDFDLCIWAAGFRLPDLPRRAGLMVNASGQMIVDPTLRSLSCPAIYAAGDIAAPLLDPGLPLPMGCKSAQPAGAHVADNLARELAARPLRAFDFAAPFYCVSLGRRAGLIQWTDALGHPTGRTLTGRAGARFKEAICKSTWWMILAEAKGLPGVVWKRTGRAPQRVPFDALSAEQRSAT